MLNELFFAPAGDSLASITFGIFGLLIGSFLNVVIYRMPKMMQREIDNSIAAELGQALPHTDTFNLVLPHSTCPHCGHAIRAHDNIPVLSYLLLRGRCRLCKTPISIRYPVVELCTGLLSAVLIWHFGSGMTGLSALVFTYILLTASLIDADTQLLPDDLTLPLLWLGLLVNLHSTFTSLSSAVLGAVAGYLCLWMVYWVYKLIRNQEGMGYGDFKLLAALGAWMGWSMLPIIILLSSLVGAVIGTCMLMLTKQGKNTPLPFGPYLAGAGLLCLIWGRDLQAYYLSGI